MLRVRGTKMVEEQTRHALAPPNAELETPRDRYQTQS